MGGVQEKGDEHVYNQEVCERKIPQDGVWNITSKTDRR